MKVKLYQRFSNIHKTKEGPDTIKKYLAKALNVVWTQDIEGKSLESLWESMHRRVVSVLYIKGWHTKY